MRPPLFSSFSALGCAAWLLVAAQGVQAQAPARSVVPVPPRPAPTAQGNVAQGAPAVPGTAAPAGTLGVPAPAGLPSVQPQPGGLTSPNPAGLPSPNPPTLTPGTPGTGTGVAPGGTALPPGLPVPPGGEVQPVAPSGVAPPVAGPGVPATPRSVPAGPGPYTALQVAQSFLGADANRDGELSRAEAHNLSILPFSFEEMDRNKDGVLYRSEYEDALR